MRAPWSPSKRARVASAVAALSLLSACRDKPRTWLPPTVKSAWPAPATDASPHCADVSDLRVCWVAPDAEGGVTATDRPLPQPSLSSLGWLCSGNGAARTCVDRALFTEAFQCDGPRCEQRHPRLPDDGEWECADIAGAVFCHGGERAAGVAPGAPDRGYLCNARVSHGAKQKERVCVDWSPDFPGGVRTGFRCKFEQEHELVRICERDPSSHVVGERCDASHPCIAGLRCGSGRCVPPRPEPSCVLDADCGERVCRFGVCTARTE